MTSKLAVIFCYIFLMAPVVTAADKLTVFVSIVPQKYVVQQIGKALVDVRAMVHPGASPATYEPRPRQMSAISNTGIYFAIGVPFERVWLEKIAAANPKMKVVHTEADVEKMPMTTHHHHVEEGGDTNGSEHRDADHHPDQGTLDPHIWLSPPLVAIQAHAILTALQAADPDNRSVYQQNHDRFITRLDDLDAILRKLFAGSQGQRFMVFHPSWGYFAHTYGIEQVAVELEGKSPKPAQLKYLITAARDKGIKVVFVQPQFSTKSASLVARAIGGSVVVADPLAEDWMANLLDVAEKLKDALK